MLTERIAAVEFERVLRILMSINLEGDEKTRTEVLATLEQLESILEKNPGDAKTLESYREQLEKIKGLVINTLIEAVQTLVERGAKPANVDRLLRNIAEARLIRTKGELVKAIYQTTDNLTEFGIAHNPNSVEG